MGMGGLCNSGYTCIPAEGSERPGGLSEPLQALSVRVVQATTLVLGHLRHQICVNSRYCTGKNV